MKNKLITVLILAFLALVGYSYIQQQRIAEIREETARYKQNTHALMLDVKKYRTSDSLHVAKVGALTLRLSELEELRARDVALINSLQVKKRELEQLTSVQTQMLANIRGTVKDSIIYINTSNPDTARVLSVSDDWIDLHGVIYKDGIFDGTLEVRDSLAIVESVQRKRFLGFLWKTKKIKSREIDVVSKNPYTTIMGVESMLIEQ